MFTPNALEFGRRILGYFILNVTHVALVELRGFSVFEDHKVNVFLSGERQTRKNLE
jgi:hypothetical protein